jgi:stearoyl-CoA desaturase (delta-9 desaturase)
MQERDESAFHVMNAGAIRPVATNEEESGQGQGGHAPGSPRALDAVNIMLFTVVSLTAIVVVPLFGYLHGYTRLDWALLGILYLASGLGITVGYHRLIAHGSFQCPDWIKAALLVAGGWAMENSVLAWAADHARHHARVDQEEDPYNAKRGFWYSHCGWVFQIDPHRTEKYAAWLRRDRVVLWQHRWYIPIVLSGLAVPFLAGWLAGGELRGLGCFLLAGVARVFLVLNSTFCINSVCHLWGTQPYSTANTSRDSWWVSLITFGEGYHNYHHAFPRDYRNGPRWYNVDPSKWLIYGFSLFGLASNLIRSRPGREGAAARG